MKHIILFASSAIYLLLGAAGHAVDPSIQSFDVTLGTLELNADIKRRFVFRVGEEEREVFNFDILSSSGIQFPGLPDLKEIGVRCTSGKVYQYGNLTKNTFAERFMKEHPDEVGESLIFEGATGQLLEIKLKGRTPVYRIDLKVQGREVTLWSNAPETPVSQSK